MARSRIRTDTAHRNLPTAYTDGKGSVSLWIEGLREHTDQQAANHLYHRYFNQLVVRLRHRINRKVRSISDPEDTAQYVLSEVLTKLDKGKYPSLGDRMSLWSLMIHIGDQRTKKVWRDSTAGKRDVRITKGLFGAARKQVAGHAQIDHQSAEAPPSLEAEVEDMIEYLIRRLSNKEYHKILIWELQGYEPQEIKQSLELQLGRKVSDRSLRRWRELMREELRAAYPNDC